MKIGVSAIGYECAEHLDKVLLPWFALQGEEVFLSVAHGVFPETAALGYPVYSTDGTVERLLELNRIPNTQAIVLDVPTKEAHIRNSTLPYLLNNNIDLLWLLDLQDEVYTVEEIHSTIEVIKGNPDYDW